jgi:hypothetical protein
VRGERARAMAYFKKLTKMGYECIDFMYDLAEMLASAGRYMEAVHLLQASIESNNRHKDTQALLDSCRDKIKSAGQSEMWSKDSPRGNFMTSADLDGLSTGRV